MRRDVFATLRRGLDNTVANWHLIAVRVAEMFLFGMIAAIAAIIIIVPIAVSIGIELAHIASPEDLLEAMETLARQWVLLVWIFVAVSVLLIVFVALHAFVEAGCARVYVDGERVAGPGDQGVRARFRVFSMDRWWAGGRDGWWAVFWIYNFAWGLAGLVPPVSPPPPPPLMLVFPGAPPAVATTGCAGVVVTKVLMILGVVVTESGRGHA